MSYITSILMGLLQGVAEFLPISSSGHLALFQHFFGGENYEETQLFFTVLLHLGTLLSVFVYYRKDVTGIVKEFFLGIGDLVKSRGKAARQPIPPARRMVLLIIVATLPLAVILPVKGLVEEAMGRAWFVSLSLLATGFILFFADRMAKGRKNEKSATLVDALVIGCAQAVGTLPGISRSGITISAGMARGCDRSFAVRFSFLLSMPAVLGANLLTLVDAIQAGGFDVSLLPVYIVGAVVAGVTGYFAISLVDLLARKGKFGAFAWYCWVAGAVTLVAGFFVKG